MEYADMMDDPEAIRRDQYHPGIPYAILRKYV